MISKIVSGGQTGADRAALDFAIQHDIPHGGWIPKGRKTEDGPLPDRYQLCEMETVSYPERTEQNVIDSDGALIVSHGALTGGSAQTLQFAKKHHRPCLHIDFNELPMQDHIEQVRKWIAEKRIVTLNIAGPRASKDPLIHEATIKLLEAVFEKPIQ